MKCYLDLYVGESLQKKGRKRKILRRIRDGEWTPDVYLILLPEGEANQLEILSAFSFLRRYPDRNSPMIIGIAFGRREVRSLLVQITQDVYDRTGKAALREYFSSREPA